VTAVSKPALIAASRAVSLSDLPTCAVRVGVIGHRPPKLPPNEEPKIRESVRQVLALVQDFTKDLVRSNVGYAMYEPKLWIVTSLAEGADRLVAEEGLNLGFGLQCPLPRERNGYQQDFETKNAIGAFNKLLSQADAVFELDGERSGKWLEPEAYEAVGRVTMAHSDLLIAIWDGDPGKLGGTGQMAKEALQEGIPTVRISTQNPSQIEFISSAFAPVRDWDNALRHALTRALGPPASAGLRATEFLKNKVASIGGNDSIDAQRDQADQVASYYAKWYRRAYKTVYWLAALAVLCAVGGSWLSAITGGAAPEWPLTALELFAIITILLVIWLGRKYRLHERWLEARVLAEQFRAWAFLASIAQAPPTARLPPYASAKTATLDWTGWYFRARVREQVMHSASLTPEYLANYERDLLRVVEDQAKHHSEKGKARKRTFEQTELATTILFALTALACFAHLVSRPLFNVEDAVFLTTLGAATAALPAFGAALEGLQAQGEYQRLAERAEGMHDYFLSIQESLSARKTNSPSYSLLANLAHEVSGVMLDELSDWRNLVRIRILRPV